MKSEKIASGETDGVSGSVATVGVTSDASNVGSSGVNTDVTTAYGVVSAVELTTRILDRGNGGSGKLISKVLAPCPEIIRKLLETDEVPSQFGRTEFSRLFLVSKSNFRRGFVRLWVRPYVGQSVRRFS